MFNLFSTRASRSYSRLLSSWVPLILSWCLRLFLLRFRTFQFPLLNLMRFLSPHLSSLPRSLWMAVWPSDEPATPSSFVSSPDQMRVQHIPSYRSLMKILNKSAPVIDLLVSGLQLDFQSMKNHPLLIFHRWSSLFGLGHSASFLSTSLSPHPAHTSTACLWGPYGRQCQRPLKFR